MTPIHVVGIGLDGADGLTEPARQIVERATLLVGSDRHLSYFPNQSASHWVLGDFTQTIEELRNRLATGESNNCIVVLVSGDPLFFGLGRLLLERLPGEQLTFHPHVSSVGLAFSRIKVPWQDALTISAHGRSMEQLIQALRDRVE